METFFLREKYRSNNNATLEINERVAISDDHNEINHIKKSKRKKNGDLIYLIDGKGNRYLAKIIDLSNRKSISFEIVEIISTIDKNVFDYNNQIELTIAVSMLNNTNKIKLLIEKLTEIGVSNFQPFLSERSSFLGKKMPDLEDVTISALKQCKGNVLININEILSFEKLLNKYNNIENMDRYYCHFDGANFFFSDNNLINKKEVIIVIGPEGGFSDKEITLLKEYKFRRVKLNKRVLRAETAAIVAASRVLL